MNESPQLTNVNDQPSVREIFLEALSKPSAQERAAWLESVCPGRPALRARVEALIRSHREDDFLQQPAIRRAGAVCGKTVEIGARPKILRYTLLYELGEGAFGVVYLAEQEEPVRRKVAIKILKPGVDTRHVIGRFEAERHVLALMEHQNIAKVFDAGVSEEGRPYFAMELVEGKPITRFCEELHLGVRQRIELFICVCDGVRHAHQKGVIHRDLKPSNILVPSPSALGSADQLPCPKIIDFGIAKAVRGRLLDGTVVTAFEQLIGTPAYMSPEQALITGDDIDTRSDIYSLGALLYEILTGAPPFKSETLLSAGFDEMRRIIREVEPVPPSRRRGRDKAPIDPDLDWIVMKCLEKDRLRRYETVGALVSDLKRFLRSEPVEARAPTRLYRFQKAFRRNKLAYVSAIAVTVALLFGSAMSGWQAVRATRANQAEEKERISAQHLLYVANMNLAQHAWDQNNIDRLQELLALTESSPDRGFEWFFWRAQTELAVKTFRGHSWQIFNAALGHDGKTFVTASEDGTVKVWDLETGKELRTLRHGGWVLTAAISPDGHLVLGGDVSGIARIWDMPAGNERLVFREHPSRVASSSFSSRGDRVVTGGGGGSLIVWDPMIGKVTQVLYGHKDIVNAVAFSPDGTLVASGGFDKTLRLWETATGRQLNVRSLEGSVLGVAFSADGTRLLSANGNSAILWNLPELSELKRFNGHNEPVTSAAFSPDSHRVVTGSMDGTAKVWDAGSGSEIGTAKGHGAALAAVSFLPDGRRFLTASRDKSVKLWDETGLVHGNETGPDRLRFRGHSSFVWSVAFSPDGLEVATAGNGDGTARVWDGLTGKELFVLTGHGSIFSVNFSPDGQKIVTAGQDAKVCVWDRPSGRELLVCPGHGSFVNFAAFSPDSQKIVSCGFGVDHTARIWEVATGRQLSTFNGHTDSVWSAAFFPDGKRVVTSSSDGTAKVWETDTGKLLRSFDPGEGMAWCVALSPDGRQIATSYASWAAKLWDVESGANLFTLKGHKDWVWNVAFSPDGKRLATGGDDSAVKLWDTATGRELLTLRGHGEPIRGLAFSPDGRRIVTGSQDKTARVWDTAIGKMGGQEAQTRLPEK